MKWLIPFLLAFLIQTSYSQTTKTFGDTLNATLSQCGKHIADTIFFESFNPTMNNPELIRFFNKNLRSIENIITGKPILGSCTAFFVIDKSGRVTQAWCDTTSVRELASEVLRVINKIPLIQPSYVNSHATITKVKLIFSAKNGDDPKNQEKDPNVDILMWCYGPVY